MAIYRPTYATRLDVRTATDIALTSDANAQIDSALMKGAEDVDDLCHRRFYNVLTTQYWDWPNFQLAYPWRIWFDERELADTTVNVPVVTSGGNVIAADQILFGPWNYSPPYTYLELNRSGSASFGQGGTPQKDVAITGLFGYWLKTRAAGTLTAAVSSTTAVTLTVSDSSSTGSSPGDVLTIGSERLLVQDCGLADTGIALNGAGGTTDNANDDSLTVSGAGLVLGEIITIDSESMLVTQVSSSTAVTVIRAYDGTTLATHSDNAEIYALRLLTVERAFGGTTAATYTEGTAVAADLVPGKVKELALAEALNTVYQKTSGYARTIGEAGAAPVPGGSLPDLRDQAYRGYGRKARQAVI